MTKPKVAPKPVAKKVVAKKAPVKKVVAKKAPVKKTVAEVDINKVTLESYSMKMVIPTGQYANIQPEIIVKAYSVEKAHDFIAPHMNKLWKEYYLINERRPEPAKVQVAPAPAPKPTTPARGLSGATYLKDTSPAPANTKPLTFDEIKESVGGRELTPEEVTARMTPDEIFPDTPSPASSVAFNKASQAIHSCMSLDALEIIRVQIEKSVKLVYEDKEKLQPLLLDKLEALSNGS